MQAAVAAAGGPRFGEFRIVCTARHEFASSEAARMALTAVGPVTGWLSTTDRHEEWIDAPSTISTAGSPLVAGELLARDGSSYRLVCDGSTWWLWRLERVNDPAGFGLVERFLVEGRADFLARYEASWEARADAQGHERLVPAVARFAGFERGGAS
jgi:hypothetical protein